tara:strand:+ start:1865 stop:2050 length:186 start_codon:yes stop_codon:yes gene_type:complete
MGLVETITKLKECSQKLRDENTPKQNIIEYSQEMHRLIDLLEIPELINMKELIGDNNEYIS